MTANWNSPINSDSFIVVCKNSYLLNLHPFDTDVQFSECYRRLDFIVGQYELIDFIGNLLEGQYYINLWASYFILEKFKPTIQEKLIGLNNEKPIVEECIETCESYAEHFKQKQQIDTYIHWMNGIKNYYEL